jgi:hypothetical protein
MDGTEIKFHLDQIPFLLSLALLLTPARDNGALARRIETQRTILWIRFVTGIAISLGRYKGF